MSLRGFRILPLVSHGGRYTLGTALVSSSYGTAQSGTTFGLLTEAGNFLVTEAGNFLEIEHS